MRSAAKTCFSGTATASTILFSLAVSLMATTTPITAYQLDSPAATLGKTKSMAEMQHEIVMLLIRKEEFDKAAAEANKIFEMKWPDDQEPLLLKELLYLSDQFLRHGQPLVGLRLLDANLHIFEKVASRVAILKEKGYLYKATNEDDKAIDCFREAQALEAKGPS